LRRDHREEIVNCLVHHGIKAYDDDGAQLAYQADGVDLVIAPKNRDLA
jgi:hypothetical protein